MKEFEEYLDIKALQVKPDDVIVITLTQNKMVASNIQKLADTCKKKFPNNQVIFLTDYISMEAIDRDKLIELYENIIEKLKNGEEVNND